MKFLNGHPIKKFIKVLPLGEDRAADAALRGEAQTLVQPL